MGRRLSERLKIPFYDTDELITKHTGRTIGEIVEERGWQFFREKEKAVIRTLSFSADTVIAVGGGAVMQAENRRALKRKGLFLWLTADVNTILQRMRNDSRNGGGRPPLAGDCAERETSGILKQRIPIYRRLADFTIDTSERDIEAVAQEFCHLLVRRVIQGDRKRLRVA